MLWKTSIRNVNRYERHTSNIRGRLLIRRTKIDTKLRAKTRVVNASTVRSGPSVLSINHDKKSFYEKITVNMNLGTERGRPTGLLAHWFPYSLRWLSRSSITGPRSFLPHLLLSIVFVNNRAANLSQVGSGISDKQIQGTYGFRKAGNCLTITAPLMT